MINLSKQFKFMISEENKKNIYDIDKLNTTGNSSNKNSKLSNFFIKYSGGLIKNKEQANIVMITIAIVFFALTLLLFFNSVGIQPPPPVNQIIEVAMLKKNLF